jgi:hypothetical protein
MLLLAKEGQLSTREDSRQIKCVAMPDYFERIIGEDKTLSIKLGTAAGQSTEDAILVRGASADVDRAVKEILQIVENAKNDEIVNSYVSLLVSIHRLNAIKQMDPSLSNSTSRGITSVVS